MQGNQISPKDTILEKAPKHPMFKDNKLYIPHI